MVGMFDDFAQNCRYINTYVCPKYGYSNDALWDAVDAVADRFGGLRTMQVISLRKGSQPGDEAVMAAYAAAVHAVRCEHSPFNSVGREQ